MRDIDLSVVIIGRNEGDKIGKCILSVKECLFDYYDYQIIYVDGNSTDNSIEFAKKYNVQVYKITKCKYLTASLGRYIGAINSQKKYILFLDGDMQLQLGWIEIAIGYLETNSIYSGVIGIRDDNYIQNGKIVGSKENVYDIHVLKEAEHFGGAILFRKSDLLQVGNYTPQIVANEEAELHSRLKKYDKKVIKIPYKMIKHFISVERKKFTLRKIIFNKRNLGIGQGIAHSILNNSFLYFLQRFKYLFLSILLDVLTIGLIFFGLQFFNYLYFLCAGGLQFILIIISIKFRKLHYYIIDKISEIFIIPGIISYRYKSDYEYIKIE